MRVESAAAMGKPSSDHPEARLGQVILGKWTLEGVVGTGGMAAVYVARDAIGRREAIKILHPEVARDPEQRRRFDQEARAANQLGHPGAVEIRDVDITEDGCPFMVMELLDGETLGELANRQDGLPLADLLRYADEVLDVLVVAHERGIVHRDIKLGNLFLTREGKIKVLDFGIARVASSHITRAGARLGTTAYMPPEQIRGEQVDGRADLFAVGATMFRVIAKRRVHEAKTEIELIAKMAMTPAPMLAAVCEAPPPVCLVVDRALAFRAAERYPDARTMQLDVQAARRGESPPYAASAAPSGSSPQAGATRVEGRHRKPVDSNAATVAPPRAEVAVATLPGHGQGPSRIGFEPTGISSAHAPAPPESVRIRVTPAVSGDEATGYDASAQATVLKPLVGLEPTSASARGLGVAPRNLTPSRLVGAASRPAASSVDALAPGSLSDGAPSIGAAPPPAVSVPAVSVPLQPLSAPAISALPIALDALRATEPGSPISQATSPVSGDPPAASAWGVPPAGLRSSSSAVGPGLVVALVGLIVGAVALGLFLTVGSDETAPNGARASATPNRPATPAVVPLAPAPAVPALPTASPPAPGPAKPIAKPAQTQAPAAPSSSAPPPASPPSAPAAPSSTAPASPASPSRVQPGPRRPTWPPKGKGKDHD